MPPIPLPSPHWLATLLPLLCTMPAIAADAPSLPALAADAAQHTVSGLSSGAFMATQFATAYSASIAGAGIVAGGPYYCSGLGARFGDTPYLTTASTLCMQGPPPSGETAYRHAQAFAIQGLIDPVANIKRQRIYLFGGSADQIVSAKVVEQTAAFYRAAQNQQLKSSIGMLNAGHALLTNNETDLACDANAFPNLNNCQFTQAQDILRHLYPSPPIQPPVSQGQAVRSFNQREFASADSGMDDIGHLYLPNACLQQSCRVHVVFHGCTQSSPAIGDRFYRTTGYNELAENNRIIVLYPRIKADPIRNPKGCWDFWGYSSGNPEQPDFYTKQAPQMAAIAAMLQRLSSTPPTLSGVPQ